MAKLPTFSASNVSGGGGAVQMQAQQRATTKPFRQSTNIRAEDIYNQAGDQAMAQAIGNIGSLFNKVQLQKTEAIYSQKQNEMREAFGRAVIDAKKEGKNADDYYRNWIKQTQDSLTKTGNSSIDRKLAMDHSTLSVNAELDIISHVGKVAREEYLGNGAKLEKDFEVAISNGKVPVEDAIHEVNLYYQNGAGNGGFFSMETARQAVLDFTVKAHTEDIKGKIDNSSTVTELNASRNLADSTKYLIGSDNVKKLENHADETQKKLKLKNLYEGQDNHDKILQRIKDNRIDPEEIDEYKDYLKFNIPESYAFKLSNEIETQVLIKDATNLKLNHPGASWDAIKKMLLVKEDRTKSSIDELDKYINGIEKATTEYNKKLTEAELNYTLSEKVFESRLNPTTPVNLVSGLPDEIKNDPAMYKKVEERQEELEKERLEKPLMFWLNHPDNLEKKNLMKIEWESNSEGFGTDSILSEYRMNDPYGSMKLPDFITNDIKKSIDSVNVSNIKDMATKVYNFFQPDEHSNIVMGLYDVPNINKDSLFVMTRAMDHLKSNNPDLINVEHQAINAYNDNKKKDPEIQTQVQMEAAKYSGLNLIDYSQRVKLATALAHHTVGADGSSVKSVSNSVNQAFNEFTTISYTDGITSLFGETTVAIPNKYSYRDSEGNVFTENTNPDKVKNSLAAISHAFTQDPEKYIGKDFLRQIIPDINLDRMTDTEKRTIRLTMEDLDLRFSPLPNGSYAVTMPNMNGGQTYLPDIYGNPIVIDMQDMHISPGSYKKGVKTDGEFFSYSTESDIEGLYNRVITNGLRKSKDINLRESKQD